MDGSVLRTCKKKVWDPAGQEQEQDMQVRSSKKGGEGSERGSNCVARWRNTTTARGQVEAGRLAGFLETRAGVVERESGGGGGEQEREGYGER